MSVVVYFESLPLRKINKREKKSMKHHSAHKSLNFGELHLNNKKKKY